MKMMPFVGTEYKSPPSESLNILYNTIYTEHKHKPFGMTA